MTVHVTVFAGVQTDGSQALLALDFAAPAELAVVQQSLGQLRAAYIAQPDDALQLLAVGETKLTTEQAPELASWTMLINELMNLDEALNK